MTKWAVDFRNDSAQIEATFNEVPGATVEEAIDFAKMFLQGDWYVVGSDKEPE